MKKEVARDVTHHLNTPKIIDTLSSYAEDRISEIRVVLDRSKDTVEIFRLQGSIEELKKLQKIREDALAVINVQKR